MQVLKRPKLLHSESPRLPFTKYWTIPWKFFRATFTNRLHTNVKLKKQLKRELLSEVQILMVQPTILPLQRWNFSSRLWGHWGVAVFMLKPVLLGQKTSFIQMSTGNLQHIQWRRGSTVKIIQKREVMGQVCHLWWNQLPICHSSLYSSWLGGLGTTLG